jgi:hypothetical protein
LGRLVLISALLAGLGAVLYWPALGNDFVYDDHVYTLAEKHLADGLSREGVRWALGNADLALYAPVTRLSLMLDFQLSGKSPRGYHLTNLAVHATNGVLLFLALAGLTGALWRSAAVAALFLVHPMNVEPVAWVSGRGDLLAGLFGLLTLLMWSRYVRSRQPGAGWWVAAGGAFLLGMMSKSIIMTLPLALLLLDGWPLGRAGAWGSGPGVGRGTGRAGLLLEKGVLFAVAAGMAALTLFLFRASTLTVSVAEFPIWARAATIPVSYVTYLLKTLWPAGLTVFYPQRWATDPWWYSAGAALLLVGVTAVVARWWRRRPYLAAGWLWFLGTLLPVIGIYQARDYPVADRYGYLPLVGLFVMGVWGLGDVAQGRRRGRALGVGVGVGVGVAVAAILACLPLSRAQIGTWRDDVTLMTRAISILSDGGRNPLPRSAWFLPYNLGNAWSNSGRYDRAEEAYRLAIQTDPRWGQPYYNLGNACFATGRLPEAAALFREAVRRAPDYADAWFNLGNTYLLLGRSAESKEAFERAARIERPGAASRNRGERAR